MTVFGVVETPLEHGAVKCRSGVGGKAAFACTHDHRKILQLPTAISCGLGSGIGV